MKRAVRLTVLLFLFVPQTILAQSPVEYPVGQTDLVLHDNSRNRDIAVRIYFPKTDKGLFPVVVFSHGAGGSKDGYAYLGNYWAAHGYICLHPNHLGSDSALVHKHRPLLTLRAVKKAVQNPDNLVNRPRDISFVLDSLSRIEHQVPGLQGHVDMNLIGVSGHSFGAYTTMAVAGAIIHLPDGKAQGFSDPRVKAFIAMSPQGTGRIGFGPDSWTSITRPVLTMSGTKDSELGGGDPGERLQAFEHMPRGDKFHVLILGANHFDFADKQLEGGAVEEGMHEFIESVTVRFWDAYLKNGPPFMESLAIPQGSYTLREDGVQASVQSK